MNSLISLTAALLLSLSPATFAQVQSGSNIGLPSTGTSADTAGAAGTSPRSVGAPDVTSGAAPDGASTSVGVSGPQRAIGPTTHSFRCDDLIGEERQRCMREAAAAEAAADPGTAGPGSTGMGTAGGSTVGPGGSAATPGISTGVR
jgi:hypothetical protein